MTAYLAPDLSGSRAYFAPDQPPSAVITPPVVGATVTAVSVSPTIASIAGGATLQLSALVIGTGSPSQGVLWSTQLGSITVAGLLTAPAALYEDQSFTVTATSTQDGRFVGWATVIVPAKLAGRTYSWLVASVASWTHRTDLSALTDDFILFAEERMSADLDARGLESTSILPTTAGVNYVMFPSGVIDVRSIAMPQNGTLDYVDPDRFNEMFSQPCSGPPRYYTVIGSKMYLGPTPDNTYSLALSASMQLPSLTNASNGVNWLIARNPSLYLAATMVEAYVYLEKPDGVELWNQRYQVALTSANSTSDTANQMVVRLDSRTP